MLETQAPAPTTPKAVIGAGFRRDVQALRALSVALVVGFHLWPGVVRGGYVGVDVFFVISGYLIVGQMVREGRDTGRIRLGQFWARRAFRLLPAALTVIVLTVLATLAWVPSDRWHQYLQQAPGSAFYVQNWVLANSATDYLASEQPPTAFQHFWSLSVEEQCYIVAPLVLALLLLARRGVRPFFAFIALITAASFVWSMYDTVANPAAAYFVTTTRVWEFGLGALLAFVPAEALRRTPFWAAWIGLAFVAVAAFDFTSATRFPGYAAALPVVGGALVLATHRHDRVFDTVAGLKPVQFVGDASYSIYLWHWPLLVIAPLAVGHGLHLRGRLVVLVLSLAVGWASMRWLELPLRVRHGQRARWSSRPVAVILVALLGVGVVVGFGQLVMRHEQKVDRAHLAEALAQIKAGNAPCLGAPALARSCPPAARLLPPESLRPQDSTVRQAGCWAGLNQDDPVSCEIGPKTGYARKVIAIGDSHNTSLIPAYQVVATKLNWQFEVMGKNGCYLTAANINDPKLTAPADAAACTRWQQKALQKILADPKADTVIVTNQVGKLAQADTPAQARAQTIAGYRTVWQKLVDAGKRVIVIQDVESLDQSVFDCVERKGAKAETGCAQPEKKVFGREQFQQEAAQGLPGVTYVPVEQDLCFHGRCPPVIGGVAVYFDRGHLGALFAASYGATLADHLAAATRP